MSLSILLSVLSIIIIGIGYSIKNVKPNPVFGIRLKWALEDETNWKKTHQFSGILWMICGLFGLFCAYIQSMTLFNLMILILCLAPVIYSYGFYRKQLKEHRTTKVKYPFYLILFMIGISLFVVYSLFCGKLTYQFYTDKLVIDTNNWKNYEIESIKSFAASQNVMPYIVIGRLQKEKKLDYRQFSNYKLRYKWAE